MSAPRSPCPTRTRRNQDFANMLAEAAGEGGASPDAALVASGLFAIAGALDRTLQFLELMAREARAEERARARGKAA